MSDLGIISSVPSDSTFVYRYMNQTTPAAARTGGHGGRLTPPGSEMRRT